MSVGICIIAHEPLASAFKSAVQHIFSTTEDTNCDDIACFDVPNNVDVETGENHAKELISPLLNKKDGVLIFTDILGATPSNIAHTLLTYRNVRVITGVDLSALVSVLTHTDSSLASMSALAEGAARSSITSIAMPSSIPRCE